MTLTEIRNESQDHFLKTGRFKTAFSVSRLQFLFLLDELRAERVFYKLREAGVDMTEPAAMAMDFDGLTVDSRG